MGIRLRLQVLIALVGLLAVVVILSTTGLSAVVQDVPDDGGTYTEGTVGTPGFINPVLAVSDIDRDLSGLVFSGLTRTNARGEIVPDLAARWDISPDAKTLTFFLRDHVTWHDGQPFSADDVVFTIKVVQDPDFRGNPDLAGLWKNVSVEKIDQMTVRFQLKDAWTPFLNYTTLGILPQHVLKDVPIKSLPENPFNANPIGTGPFRVGARGITAVQATLERNPAYYQQPAHLEFMRFAFYPNAQAMLADLAAERIDGVSYVPSDRVETVQQNPDLQVYTAQLPSYDLLLLNLRSELFERKEVRQAISSALDRPRLLAMALDGQGVPAFSPIVPISWAYRADLKAYKYDPAAAGALLDQAGWKLESGLRRKGDTDLQFTLLTNDSPERVRLAQEIKNELAAIGIRVNVEQMKFAELLRDRLMPHKFDAVVFGWKGLANDPDPYQLWHSTQADKGSNFAGFKNDRADKSLEQARQSLNQGERFQLYSDFQDVFAEEVPSVLLYYPFYSFAIRDQVRGVELGMLDDPSDRFRDVTSWYVRTKRVVVPPGTAAREQVPR